MLSVWLHFFYSLLASLYIYLPYMFFCFVLLLSCNSPLPASTLHKNFSQLAFGGLCAFRLFLILSRFCAAHRVLSPYNRLSCAQDALAANLGNACISLLPPSLLSSLLFFTLIVTRYQRCRKEGFKGKEQY